MFDHATKLNELRFVALVVDSISLVRNLKQFRGRTLFHI